MSRIPLAGWTPKRAKVRDALASRAILRKRSPKQWAQVAQLVEHVTENHGVGGSIPSLGTIAGADRPGDDRAQRSAHSRSGGMGEAGDPPDGEMSDQSANPTTAATARSQ